MWFFWPFGSWFVMKLSQVYARCLCLGLTGNRLVIFEIFLEQLQNLVFLLFFVFLFFITLFVCFSFLFVSEVLILSLEVCRLILHFRWFSTRKSNFIMLFFLNIFAQNAHFFLCGHRFLYARCETKCFGETKKSFIILWFYFCFDLFLSFTGCFGFFFSFFFFFYFVWGDFVFWGFFFCVWEEVFFIIHKQIFDDFSIFLYIFFSLYRHFFFLNLYLKITHGKNLFLFLFSFNFRPGYLGFLCFCLVLFDFSWLVFK